MKSYEKWCRTCKSTTHDTRAHFDASEARDVAQIAMLRGDRATCDRFVEIARQIESLKQEQSRL